MRLNNRVAIVTGGGRGLGKAIGVRLAQEGAKVVIADIDGDSAQAVAQRIIKESGMAINVKVNVSEKKEVERMVEIAVAEFDKIDILVNNAGIQRAAPLLDLDEDKWDEVINVNLKGSFLCIQQVTKYMIPQRYGKIINISSRAYLSGGPVNYVCAKAGIVGLTLTLAKELGIYNINVNCIAPSRIETPLLYDVVTKEEFDIYIKKMIEITPLRRLGQPLDVANAVLFMASDESSFITGEILHVTGGSHLPDAAA